MIEDKTETLKELQNKRWKLKEEINRLEYHISDLHYDSNIIKEQLKDSEDELKDVEIKLLNFQD